MTKVYRIKNDVNHYQYFLAENEEEDSKLRMDCMPRRDKWTPPSVYIHMPKLQRGDFFNFNSSMLILSPRAREILYTYLVAAGELLSLPWKGQTFTVLNVTECINCLDHENTKWRCRESTGTRLWIDKYAFHKTRFSESNIFKIPETCKSELLVVCGQQDPEDDFKYTVESSGLKGLIFEKIWEG